MHLTPTSSGHRNATSLALILLVAACADSSALPRGQGGGGGQGPGSTASSSGDGTGGAGGRGGEVGPEGSGGAGGENGVGGAGAASEPTSTGSAPACLASTAPCDETAECCEGLTCDTTTLGRVCCGEHGAPCATANGEECCRDLLCIGGSCLPPGGAPDFQAPFPCGETWTYSHHANEVRRAVDFVNASGATDARPILASAAGTATRHFEAGGAGNYVVIQHGGGWSTYYFHLQSFSVADGAAVARGQEIGLVGSTGASSGPHLHYEQLRDGVGHDVWLNGVSLTPYPGQYFQASVVSENCPDR